VNRPVTYLPDVNVLVSAHIKEHVHHDITRAWLQSVPVFATCALTETGMVRLLATEAVNPQGTPALALAALSRLRLARSAVYWSDDSTLTTAFVDTTRITGPRQVSDFHLLNLAASRGGVMVTTDKRIEGAINPADRKHLLTL